MAFFESVLASSSGGLNFLVPVMTSNTAPSGVASATNMLSGVQAWYAFNASQTNVFTFASTAGGVITYQFSSAKKIRMLVITPLSAYEFRRPTKAKIEISTNGSTWTSIYDGDFYTHLDFGSLHECNYVRATLSTTTAGATYCQFAYMNYLGEE